MLRNILLVLLYAGVFTGCYAQETLSASIASEPGITLQGTLTIPAGDGPFPVAILVHGSGPGDRNQSITLNDGNSNCLYPFLFNKTIRNFQDIAEDFQANGIACLRYDKRTKTYPAHNPTGISPNDFIHDVHSAIDYIKGKDKIDTSCILLLGHSQGANFVPLIANSRDDITAIMCLGTPASGIDSLLAYQYRELYIRCLNDTVQGDSIYNLTTSRFDSVRAGTWDSTRVLEGAYLPFWSDWLDITDSAIHTMNKVQVPTLMLQATEDFNVPMTEAQKFEDGLTNDSVNLKYMQGLTHHFTNSSVASVTPQVFDTIYTWLRTLRPKLGAVGVTDNLPRLQILIGLSENHLVLKWRPSVLINLLQIFNSAGQLAYEINHPDSRELSVPKSELGPAGVYIVHVRSKQGVYRNRIIIQE